MRPANPKSKIQNGLFPLVAEQLFPQSQVIFAAERFGDLLGVPEEQLPDAWGEVSAGEGRDALRSHPTLHKVSTEHEAAVNVRGLRDGLRGEERFDACARCGFGDLSRIEAAGDGGHL